MIYDKNIADNAMIQPHKLLGAWSGMPQGETFYVLKSGATNAYNAMRTKVTPTRAFLTLTAALAKCVANRGDTIIILPGHTETIAAAGGITIDKAGVSIIGLGAGSLRPTFTWSATASTLLVTAANVTIKNILCLVSIDSVVIGIDISAAGCTLDAVDFQETSAKQMLIFINTAAAADYLTIKNCRHVQAAAGSAKWIDLVGADWARIENNFFHVSASTHILGGTTTASLEVLIKDNLFVGPADAAAVVMLAASTGFALRNAYGGAKTSQAGAFALANLYGAENRATNVVNTNGIVDPAADT